MIQLDNHNAQTAGIQNQSGIGQYGTLRGAAQFISRKIGGLPRTQVSPMKLRNDPLKPRNAADWTRERIEQLGKQEIEQLRLNAERLGETAVAALCGEALKARPRTAARRRAAPGARTHARHLISRSKAFEARGVFLQDTRSSWSGVRKSDGAVVMTLWADAVASGDGGCSHLLWAPNLDGSRPWSDRAAGKERLEHCRLALERGGAEGLLVYGERLDGHIPEDRARSVRGVDPETVIHFQVEQRGQEYWAIWGRKTEQGPL